MTATVHGLRKLDRATMRVGCKCARKGCHNRPAFVEEFRNEIMPATHFAALCRKHARILSSGCAEAGVPLTFDDSAR